VKWMLDTDTCIAIIKKHPVALKKLRGKSIGQVGRALIDHLRRARVRCRQEQPAKGRA